MEEKKTIRIGLSTLIIIVAIMFVAVVACVVLTMNLLKNSLSNEVSSLKESVHDFYSSEKRYEQYITTYSQKLKYILEGDSIVNISLKGDRQYELPGISSVYLNAKNEVYVTIEKNSNLYKTYGDSYNIGDNVASIYVSGVGKSGYSQIFLVKLDGTVDYVDGVQAEEGLIEVKTIDELKHVVNIVDCTVVNEKNEIVHQPIFIDIEGNIYCLTENGAKLY